MIFAGLVFSFCDVERLFGSFALGRQILKPCIGVGQFLVFLNDQIIATAVCQTADLVHHAAGTSGDQTTHDHVFLQAFQRIGLAGNRRLGQNAGRFLEGSRRDKGPCLQACLGDAKQHRSSLGRFATFFHQTLVEQIKLDTVNMLTGDHAGVASFRDFNFLQHLANNHLDVLVVDHNALQAVDFLDLVDEVGSKCLNALDRQNVMRCRIAVEDVIPLLDLIAFLKMERLSISG